MKAKIDVRKRIENARKSFEAGDYDRALQDIDEALRLDESNTEALSLREQIAAAGQRAAAAMAADAVRRAASEGDPDRRVEILQAAAVRNPEDQHLQMLLVLNESRRDVLAAFAARARFLDRKRRFDEALEQLRLLESLDHSYPGLRELMATVLRHKEHPEEVVDLPVPPPVVVAPPPPPPAPKPPAAVPPPPPPAPAPVAAAPESVPQKPAVAPLPPPKAPAPPTSSRLGLWIGIAAAVVVIAAGGAFFAMRGGKLATESKPPEVQQPVAATPQPASPLVRVDTNITGGQYSVDNGAPQPLQEGQASLGDLAAGQHTVKVALPKYGESTMSVEIAAGQPPRIVSVGPAKDIASFAISSFKDSGSLQASVPNLPVKLESGDTLGKTGEQPVALKGAPGAEQRLVIGEGEQQFLVTAIFDTRPELLWVLRGSAPPTGSVRVIADQDDVIVRIDGKVSSFKLRDGESHSFRDLSPGRHDIRVEKPGYTADPPSRQVTIVTGKEQSITFRLVGMVTVELKGATPGARVSINGNTVGTVGPDGSGHYTVNSKEGTCRLELKQEDFLHKPVDKPCKPGEPVTFSGDEVKMVGAGYLIWSDPLPAGATVSIVSDKGEKMPGAPPRITLPVGKYSVTITAPGYKPKKDGVEVHKGTGSLMGSDLEK